MLKRVFFLLIPILVQGQVNQVTLEGLTEEQLLDTAYYASEKNKIELINSLSESRYIGRVKNQDYHQEYLFILAAYFKDLYYSSGDTAYFSKSKDLFKAMRDYKNASPRDEATAYYYLGEINFWTGKYDKALQDLYKAEIILERIGLLDSISGITTRLLTAELYFDIKNYQKALKILKPIDLTEIPDDELSISWAINLSKSLFQNNEITLANSILNFAIKKCEEIDCKNDEYFMRFPIDINLLKAKYSLKEGLLQQASSYLDEIDKSFLLGEESHKLVDYYSLLAIYNARTDTLKARIYLDSAISQAKESDYLRDVLSTYETTYRTSIEHGIRKPEWLLDSLYFLTVSDLNTAYRAQNDMIEEIEERKREIERERQINQIIWIIGVTALVSLIILSAIIVHNRNKKIQKLQTRIKEIQND